MFLCLALFLVACVPAGDREHVFAGPTMGSRYTVKVVAPAAELSAPRLEALEAAIVVQLQRVDERMSTYREDSELSRFNAYRGTEPFALSADTLTVLAASQEVSAASGGTFDVTVRPLVNAWGFGTGTPRLHGPSAEELAGLRRHVGYQKLELDLTAGTARKLDPELTCDLSAVAPGYAADRIAAALEQLGVRRYMVEVGGEVRTGGRNAQGQPWRIGIERPVADQQIVQRVVPLAGLSLATSGDYRNFYQLDGRRISHTINPHSGEPVLHSGASVSVVHESCMMADAWATAMMVLGPEAGYRLAESENLAALFLVHDQEAGWRELATPAFEALLAQP